VLERAEPESDLWPRIAAVFVFVIVLAAIFWSRAHPFGIHWDEAQYFNEIQLDVQRLRAGLLLKLGGRLLLRNGGRPPAYRLLALPVLGVFGFTPTLARFVSLACYALSALFVYLATKLVSSKKAGAIAALVFCLSPEVVSASIFYGTDGSLYLATSSMLYFIFSIWKQGSVRLSHWLGLGCALALGLLAKTSFLAIAFPVLAGWFVISRWGRLGIPSLVPQAKAGLVAAIIAGPWWFLNAKDAFAYGRYARGFVRNSLGNPSLSTWGEWFNTVFQCLLGHGVSILIAFVTIAWLIRAALHKNALFDEMQIAALGACVCAGIPIVLLQLTGTNHQLRHITPAVIPLAIAVGLLAQQAGWMRPAPLILTAVLCSMQLGMLIFPVLVPNNKPVDLGFVNGALPWRVMSRFDQWDWNPLRTTGLSCGQPTPKIAFLGYGRSFGPPQIEYSWISHVPPNSGPTLPLAEATWLWRYEDGPIDWQKVMQISGEKEFILTAPGYRGEALFKENLDNEHNQEFFARLSNDPRFSGPEFLLMGRFEPVNVAVFWNRNLVCNQRATVQTGPGQ
jgi:4-amino-4-deoxy-L-arabinose transferase-like glycosyltransferase